jgi:DNA replication protein DnaC
MKILNPINPSLSQYNQSVPFLMQEGYKEVCRTAEEIEPGRYLLFAAKSEGAQTAAIQNSSPPPAAVPAGTQASEPAFQNCQPMVDSWKRTMPMAMNDAGATYLATIIPAIDGCSTPGPNNTAVYKFTTDPLSLGMAIDKIKADIAGNKLPNGVDTAMANSMIAGLEQIRAQDQAYVASQGLERQAEMQDHAIVIQIAATIGATVLSVGVISYFFYKQLKVSQQMLAQNKALIEERAGVVTNPLEAYARNLNEEYTSGRMEPVNIDMRSSEIQNARTALMMDRSVVFTGPAGVGKTAVAEALAAGIEQGLYPELQGAKIYMLDLNAMEAGTKYRGSFEERLKAVLDEVAKSRNNGGRVILFIDELHRLIGTGAAENTQGAAQVLKTPLARGEIVIIGATTEEEFQKHIAEDPALARRFSKVFVRPMTAQETIIALDSKLPKIGAARGPFPEMRITPEALEEVVRLADKYLPNESFPAKADSLLKEAVAHKRLRCSTMDPATATELTREDVRNYFEVKYRVSLPHDDDHLPPGAPAAGGSPQSAPSAAPRPSGAKFAALPANLPIIVDGVPVTDMTRGPVPKLAEALVISGGNSYSPRVVAMATPEGYIMRAITSEAMETPPSSRSGGIILRATPGSSASTWSQFGTSAAFNVAAGVGAWGLINYVIEPAIGRELEWYESMGIYGGTGIAGSALLTYLAGSSPQWGSLIAGVPAGFASFFPIGYSMSTAESLLGIDPASPEGELFVIGGGGILAAAAATAELPAAAATYFGVSTAAEAGLTTAGVGLGAGTGVVVGASFLGGVLIGYGIDEGLGELGVCNSDKSDCSLTGYLAEKMAENYEWCPDRLECWAPWNWF